MEIPPLARACLWSYDCDRLDTERDKKLIIEHILNYGTEGAVTWLHQTYSKDDLCNVFRTSTERSWSPKSLRYWSLMLGTYPERTDRLPHTV